MKVVVLGIDGATLDQIERGVEAGELGGFERLMNEGTWGLLRSTIPPDSPPAWTSFATGMNPGRHGVFGFMARRPGGYGYEIGSSRLVRSATFWQLASRGGLKVGVINVPFTYPPQPVNGFVVAGMMTPDLRSPFTYPPDLARALLRKFPNYSVAHGLGKGRGEQARLALAGKFAETISARERAMRWLDGEFRPDLLVCVFTVLDRLQHFFWPGRQDEDTKAQSSGRVVRRAYRRLDRVVQATLDSADGDTLVVVLSDHGFGTADRTFLVNHWLAQQGHLAVAGRCSDPPGWARQAAGAFRRMLALVPGGEHLREHLRARRLVSTAFVRAINWSRTRAWFGLDRGLWLNVRGREPEGTVAPGEYESFREQLIAEIEAAKDPQTGLRIINKAYKREEIYRGHALSAAPDIVLEPTLNENGRPCSYTLSERITKTPEGEFVVPSAPINGHHTSEGVIFLWGPGVRQNLRLSGASILDVAPTILWALGLAGFNAMDGKVLDSAFEGPLRAVAATGKPVQAEKAPAACVAMGKRQQALIEKRLQDLGYMD